MENLNKVVKEIKIVAKPAKRGGKNYFVRVELVNGRSADVWCDKEIVELIQTCTELGVEPFKSFTLERRTSEKTGAEYIAVVLKMFNFYLRQSEKGRNDSTARRTAQTGGKEIDERQTVTQCRERARAFAPFLFSG